MKFTEDKLEEIFIDLLEKEGFPYFAGSSLHRNLEDVIIEDDLKNFLRTQYKKQKITEIEIQTIILHLKTLPASDLYESNKTFIKMLSDGFSLKREVKLINMIYYLV